MPASHHPMLARSGISSGVRAASAQKKELPASAGPADVLERLRRLVAEGQVTAARLLLDEAVRRFPESAEIERARRILAVGEPSPNPYVQPTAGAEIEWLKDPPQEALGKWVALIGSRLVGMADTADELMASLKSEAFDQLPVVQYIAS